MSSTSSRSSAWRSGSIAGSSQPTSSTSCPTCSSCAACRNISDPTTGPSLSQSRYGTGSRRSGPGRPISNPEALGRTAISKASTLDFATSCSMAKSSTPSLKPGSSLKAGGASTIRCAHTVPSATGRPLQRCLSPQPRGRLRYPNRLRRPRWRRDRQCTNIPLGPPNGG